MYCIFVFLILYYYIGIYKNNYFWDLIGYDRKVECIYDYLIRCQRDCYGKMFKIVFQKLIKLERSDILIVRYCSVVFFVSKIQFVNDVFYF